MPAMIRHVTIEPNGLVRGLSVPLSAEAPSAMLARPPELRDFRAPHACVVRTYLATWVIPREGRPRENTLPPEPMILSVWPTRS